ncbi:hypothetical protein SAMN05660642_02553 [Geodermatophilus siccatus]|uniref:Uncharacterized protein n=1 Tax=Geodermatophilus siccatus TaxID=1137991 RepID=A0A1G9TL11_9ACTN|nr:hypothetical protein [Geodermatophilus siccatus]SDM48391.1 hypothetical protein SAMN05660642_02553 [Geodermatophilus siccatus]
MTTPADVRTDGEAFAACLAGRPVPAGAQGLAAFTDAVRASATEPGRPNAALAELLATGLLVPTQEPSRGTAGRPARTSRKRPHVLISTLTAKFVAAGAVAKAAAAGGVVAVALTGAATAGALPGQEDTAVVESSDAADVSDAPEDTTADETTGTGADTDGTVTDGTVTDGTDPNGTDTDGTVTDGTDPNGTDTDGTVTDGTDAGGTGTGDTADVVADEDGDVVSGDPATVPPVTEPAPESPEGAEGGKPTDEQKFDRHPENPGRAASAEAHQRNAERKAERAVQPEAGTPEDGGTEEVLEAEQVPVVEQPAAPAPHTGKGNSKK